MGMGMGIGLGPAGTRCVPLRRTALAVPATCASLPSAAGLLPPIGCQASAPAAVNRSVCTVFFFTFMLQEGCFYPFIRELDRMQGRGSQVSLPGWNRHSVGQPPRPDLA